MSILTRPVARVLGPEHAAAIERVVDADPLVNCVVAARLDAGRSNGTRFGGTFWGVDQGRSGLCFAGPNLVPLSGDERALKAFAALAGRYPRFSASVCGRRELVLPLWEQLGRRWGPARAIRDDQPFLICPAPPAVAPDPLVRLAQPADLAAYFPAAVAMFTDEIGSSPCDGDGGRSYRRRVAELIDQGHSFVRFEGDQVVFKAELGSVSRRAALIQGVWVDPAWRGRGIGTAGIAAVVAATQRTYGVVPSLYVNAFNEAARAIYRHVGFQQVATYSSVLF